jgi:hypothetical protein
MRAGVATSPTSKEKPGEPPEQQPERVLVGNLIGEDHVNYVLMYNMLTGIRIGVCVLLTQMGRRIADCFYRYRDAKPKYGGRLQMRTILHGTSSHLTCEPTCNGTA